jgi:phosphohistidine swiveling domain-containing protein
MSALIKSSREVKGRTSTAKHLLEAVERAGEQYLAQLKRAEAEYIERLKRATAIVTGEDEGASDSPPTKVTTNDESAAA